MPFCSSWPCFAMKWFKEVCFMCDKLFPGSSDEKRYHDSAGKWNAFLSMPWTGALSQDGQVGRFDHVLVSGCTYITRIYIYIYNYIYIIYIIYIQYIQIRRFQKMGVPPNIPKSSIWNGLSIVNHPAIGATPWKAPYPWGRSRSPQDCPQLPQQPGLLQVRGLPSPWRRLSAAITWFFSMEYAAIWSICH